ncbi:MAG: helix-turn-helix domain-containing protein [Ignavibacteriae bacterium]|nr:helix-turn-helix domain-containing protein [Ignavibacteriota bacterium]MCB9215694.1 helix-turn-helix domain-containing protein [Ignavibacteria bacterium]
MHSQDLSSSERLMTRQEAADYLGVKASTLSVWDCTKRYNLQPVKVGRRAVRYRRRHLDDFLERWKPQCPA